MNNVNLIGRLTKDVELKVTQNGKYICSFSLAVNRIGNKDGEKQADFINCVAWSKTAETLKNYTSKGNQIGVQGRIQTRNYEDKNGKKVYLTEVMVERIDLLEKKKSSTEYTEKPTNYGTVYPIDMGASIDDEDLPF